MADPADIGQLSEDIFVLSIQVVGDVATNFPKYATDILNDPGVQRQLNDQLLSLTQKQFEAASSAPSKNKPSDQAVAFIKEAGKDLQPAALNELKKDPVVKELINKAQQLGEALQKKPIGIWVDEHKNVIYVVAAAAALGGVVALYHFHTGDVVTDAFLPLLDNKQVKWKGFTFGVSSLRLEPSKEGAELKGFITKDWKKVKVTLNLSGKVVGEHIAAAGGGVQAIVPVSGRQLTSSSAGNSGTNGSGSADTDSVGMGVSLERGKLKLDVTAQIAKKIAQANGRPAAPNWDFSATAGVNYEETVGGVPMRFGVKGSYDEQPPPGGSRWMVLGTVTFTLGK